MFVYKYSLISAMVLSWSASVLATQCPVNATKLDVHIDNEYIPGDTLRYFYKLSPGVSHYGIMRQGDFGAKEYCLEGEDLKFSFIVEGLAQASESCRLPKSFSLKGLGDGLMVITVTPRENPKYGDAYTCCVDIRKSNMDPFKDTCAIE